tara:strand:- start:165 stop:305 length:141 start_codon:yes stop_codon:yes gene_type:complete
MNINSILVELDEVLEKLKMKIVFYQKENQQLKETIKELKLYVLNMK